MLFAPFRLQEIKKVTASDRSRPAALCPSNLTAPNKSHRPPLCHPERTRISYFTALPAATYAALRKESRMKSTEATVLDRKSWGSRGICGAPRLPHKSLGFVSSHADSLARGIGVRPFPRR